MTRSQPPADVSKLEDDLREALRRRAASTPAGGDRTARTRPAGVVPPSGHRRSPSRLVVAAAALVGVAVLAAGLARAGTGSDADTETAEVAPGGRNAEDLPDAEVPRLVIEGAPSPVDHDEGASPVSEEPARQWQFFRQDGRSDGPMVFVLTMRPHDPDSLDPGADGGEPVDVRGRVGSIAHGDGGTTKLSVDLGDGSAINAVAVGLTDDELVGFVDGLAPASDGRWSATVAPPGVAEVEVAPPPADGHYYTRSFDLPGIGEVEVNLYQDGFVSRLVDLIDSSDRPIEPVTVDGFPATLGASGDRDWWVVLEPEPGRALRLGIVGDRDAVDEVLSRARFVDEATWDDPEYGDPGNEPSQSPEDARRDGVDAAIAALPLRDRLQDGVSIGADEGTWWMSLADPDAFGDEPCLPADPDTTPPRVLPLCVTEYSEVLLLDEAQERILAAVPLPGLNPGWIHVTDDHVYAGSVGDGALPDSALVRIDRATREATTVVLPHDPGPTERYPDGWLVATPTIAAEGVSLVGVGSGPGTPVWSVIGDVRVDLPGVDALINGLTGSG